MCLGYKIKKGWSVNIDVKSVHFDPELYSDPYKFNPSRFDVSFFFSHVIYFQSHFTLTYSF